MDTTAKANRLIHATSPYLLQHAYNPVDWFEWGEESLQKAKRENKPILVSIGYSSCHWCHVMEHEVFEKDEIAAVMNDALVCIKVDREERPDIDAIYMEAVQAMGVNGGWPLNVFLTPDQKPFYGGTYFPPDQWMNVINGVARAFRDRTDEVVKSAEELTKYLAIQDTAQFKKAYEFKELSTELDAMFAKLASAFDEKWGGLDKAPKFIMPSVWIWALRYHYVSQNPKALAQLKLTLEKIAWGGIYDQLGGGFARYSVDGYWFVPHFEKMLYDNAQLMSLYAESYAVTKDELFKDVVVETFEWLASEMSHPDGGFFAALDADSEGVEGKFYVWTKKEIEEKLGSDAKLICEFYNVKDEGNWEHGNNILIRTQNDESFLKAHGLSRDEWRRKLRQAKDHLLSERDRRIRPGLDDKIVTAWNAMMIVGLVDAFHFLRDQRFLDAALKNIRFLENNVLEGSSVYRSFKTKRSETKGFLDDYAYLIRAHLKLYQATFDEYHIKRAELFVKFTVDKFYDPEDGFFFYTSNESEILIARRKEIFDNVIPSSNSVMMQNLFELGTLLDNDQWKRMAESLVNSLTHLIVAEPNYMSNWGIAFMEVKHQLAEVVVAGEEAGMRANDLIAAYHPFSITMQGGIEDSALSLAFDKKPIDGKTTFYVCYDRTCQKPVFDLADAIDQVRKMRNP